MRFILLQGGRKRSLCPGTTLSESIKGSGSFSELGVFELAWGLLVSSELLEQGGLSQLKLVILYQFKVEKEAHHRLNQLF